MPSIHSGHRSRVKTEFLARGLEGWPDHRVLELLLFYAIARVDTKPLARSLLDRFGSLALVLEATVEELQAVPGVGESVATYLTLITAAGRYYQKCRSDRPVILDSTEKYGSYLADLFYGRRNETVYELCLDAKCKVLCCQKVGEGDVNSANIPIRRMVEIALSVNATTVILAHNHPSGVALPSAEDVQTTRRIAAALNAVEVHLADHSVPLERLACNMPFQGWCIPPVQLVVID